MITTLVGFCESLTFCAPNKVNTVGNIANASQENLGFRGLRYFMMQKANVLSRFHLNTV